MSNGIGAGGTDNLPGLDLLQCSLHLCADHEWLGLLPRELVVPEVTILGRFLVSGLLQVELSAKLRLIRLFSSKNYFWKTKFFFVETKITVI